MMSRRSFVLGLASVSVALCVLVVPVLAAELMGTIKSVDADNDSFVVTSDAGKDVTVKVNSSTVFETAKGKEVKKALDRLATGGSVEVTHEKGVASKVILKKGAIKKKEAN
jgi:Domain of unknown function (DUF5666)